MKNDDWAKLSSLAEIASSAAVLITLVYLSIQTVQLSEQNRQLALQTEQNTSAILATRRQDLVQMEVDYLRQYLAYPEMAIDNPVSLIPDFDDDYDTETKVRKVSQAAILMRMRENSWFQYQNGVLDKETWETYLSVFVATIRNDPYSKAAWDAYSSSMFPEFANQVNAALQ